MMEDAKMFLRALEPDDAERIHAWHIDPELYRHLIGAFHYASLGAAEDSIRSVHEKFVDQAYRDGCFKLGGKYPDLCANVYAICGA